MLQIPYIKANLAHVKERLTLKNFKALNILDEILSLDENRRNLKSQIDDLLAEQNKIAKEVGQLMKEKRSDEAQTLKDKTAALKEESKQKELTLTEIEGNIQNLLLTVPNLPHQSVPAGITPEDNEVIYQVENLPTLFDDAKPHWELTTSLDIIDFELGVKITGAGFPVYKGKGARLQRALINFFLDQAGAQGYREVQPPVLVNEASGFGTGQLPDKEGQMYHVPIDGMYLVPTAEVPVTNFYRDVIVQESELPIKNTAYTPCFRREAGSYGKDVRGLNRLHQFDKVEIVEIEHPDKSYETLERMRNYVQSLLEKLELPYRVLRLCGGDMSFASALTYDMEVYSAGQKRWLEVSSVSNFETFQANRMKLRFKAKEDGKNYIAHTLNGSALALPRIVASLLENNQLPDGRIKIPAVLVPYTGFEFID